MTIDPGDDIDVESALFRLQVRLAHLQLITTDEEYRRRWESSRIGDLRVSVWLVRGE